MSRRQKLQRRINRSEAGLLNEWYGGYYELFDYLRMVKVDTRILNSDFERDSAFRLNSACPVIVKRGGLALDVIAADYGFENDSELFYRLLSYKPKYKMVRQLMAELGLDK